MERLGFDPGLVEGGYIETPEGLLFTVKGVHHPEGLTVAYLRYVPYPGGERERGGRKYRRVYDLDETSRYLRDSCPQYLNFVKGHGLTLQSVPNARIVRVYDPRERLGEVIENPKQGLEEKISKFVDEIVRHGVPMDRLGVSGSALLGLDKPDSDIDVVVYGIEAGRQAYEALNLVRAQSGWITPYAVADVDGVTRSRWGDTGLDLGRLGVIETEKILHGLADGVDYFVRLVREPGEVEEEITSRPLGKVRLRATVRDDRLSLFAPCSYGVDSCSYVGSHGRPEPSELVSYRGKFTEQAVTGERVEARGTLEAVEYLGRTVHRVMLGGRGDYLVPVTVFDR